MKTKLSREKREYCNFAELEKSERRGVDYSVVPTDQNSDTLILVPHGGGIEPGTSEIGHAIADRDYGLYLFEGLKYSYNCTLHITSNNFDEPAALAMALRSTRTIAIHGCNAMTSIAYVGGRDALLATRIIHALNEANITAKRSSRPSLQGKHRRNICNGNRVSKGVQIELAKMLRRRMFTSLSRSGREKPTQLFYDFVGTIRGCLAGE